MFAVDINTARTIYEMTMIFVSCCLGLILFVFVVCILKKAYCSPRTSRRTSPNHMDGGGMQDMFGLCSDQHQNASGVSNDQFFPYSINVPFEKPPTYEETLRIMRCEIGVPPPEYQGDGGSGALTNASTMISMDVARSSITAHVQNVDTQTTLPAATGTATGTASNRRSVVPTMIMAGDQAFSIVSGHRVALNRSFSSPLVSNLVRYQSEQRYEPRPLQGHDNGAFMRE